MEEPEPRLYLTPEIAKYLNFEDSSVTNIANILNDLEKFEHEKKYLITSYIDAIEHDTQTIPAGTTIEQKKGMLRKIFNSRKKYRLEGFSINISPSPGIQLNFKRKDT